MPKARGLIVAGLVFALACGGLVAFHMIGSGVAPSDNRSPVNVAQTKRLIEASGKLSVHWVAGPLEAVARGGAQRDIRFIEMPSSSATTPRGLHIVARPVYEHDDIMAPQISGDEPVLHFNFPPPGRVFGPPGRLAQPEAIAVLLDDQVIAAGLRTRVFDAKTGRFCAPLVKFADGLTAARGFDGASAAACY